MNECWKQGRSQLYAAVLTAGALIGAKVALRMVEAGPAGRALIALSPAPFFALLFWTMVRSVKKLDELQRRVMLESLAIGFSGAAFLLFLYDQLMDAEIGAPELKIDTVVLVMIVIWMGGYALTAMRYR